MDYPETPNILWIFVEDINPLLSCYGVENNPTPHIDQLAADGVRFANVFAPCPVCSPARSGMITGMMPTTIGVHHHQSSRTIESGIYLPDHITPLPQLFKEAGYYTFNCGKDDYNFMYQREKLYAGAYQPHFWYLWQGEGHWRDRKPGQPFFGQIQLTGGKHALSQRATERLGEHATDRRAVAIPPYYPEHPVIREEWGRLYDSLRVTDLEVGEIVAQLREDGLLESTIIFFVSDHGMKPVRHKQFCYDGGLHIPLIVTAYGGQLGARPGTAREDLASGIDIAATTLALAGFPVPDYMESRDLLAADYAPRSYVIAGRDRCDFTIDHIRAVRTERFKYIRNGFPERPYMQSNYRDERDEVLLMKELCARGRLDAVQARFWADTRPTEELYDLRADPHEIKNLAERPEHAGTLRELRKMLDAWIAATDDRGQYPENIEALRWMYERWGAKCINPEFEAVKTHPRPGTPKHCMA